MVHPGNRPAMPHASCPPAAAAVLRRSSRLQSTVGGIAVPRSSPRFKQAEITRALKGAQAAGFQVAHIRIAVDGSIEIDASRERQSEPNNAFDAWKAGDAHKA
jgi:hypothetical protein